MAVTFLHNLFQIFAYERLAARKVYELQLRQRLKVCRLDFLLPVGRVLPDVAHLATHRTTVRQNNACVSRTRNFQVCHYCLFIYQYFVVIFVYEAYFLEICSPYRAYFAVLCSLCGYLLFLFNFNRHTVTSHVTHYLSTICSVTVIWRNRHICHHTTCVAVYQN